MTTADAPGTFSILLPPHGVRVTLHEFGDVVTLVLVASELTPFTRLVVTANRQYRVLGLVVDPPDALFEHLREIDEPGLGRRVRHAVVMTREHVVDGPPPAEAERAFRRLRAGLAAREVHLVDWVHVGGDPGEVRDDDRFRSMAIAVDGERAYGGRRRTGR